jgi:hypothetical protein
LLANVVLNRLDWFLHGHGHHGQACDNAQRSGRPNVRFVRYADDWCVFITRGSKRYAQRLRDQIRELLDRDCGVRLSDERTRITHGLALGRHVGVEVSFVHKDEPTFVINVRR